MELTHAQKYVQTYKGRAVKLGKDSRYSAKIKGRAHELSVDYIEKLLRENPNCQATGIPLCYESHIPEKALFAPSLDRTDSNKGYTKDNVKLVCWAYNQMKSDNHEDLILKIADGIRKIRNNNGRNSI